MTKKTRKAVIMIVVALQKKRKKVADRMQKR